MSEKPFLSSAATKGKKNNRASSRKTRVPAASFAVSLSRARAPLSARKRGEKTDRASL